MTTESPTAPHQAAKAPLDPKEELELLKKENFALQNSNFDLKLRNEALASYAPTAPQNLPPVRPETPYTTLSAGAVQMLDRLRASIEAALVVDPDALTASKLLAVLGTVSGQMAESYEAFLHEVSGRVPGLPHNRVYNSRFAAERAFPADQWYVSIETATGEFRCTYCGNEQKEASVEFEVQTLRCAGGLIRAARLIGPGHVLRLAVRRQKSPKRKPETQTAAPKVPTKSSKKR